ncbi:hypothetical protein [Halosimplex salinum]|uniref:hypothetical protein n=1 Tax=Halosimplex salinum TaxID=1710538 RepID=UPI000F471B99|nr:hypothetical protein [Halosimplex salinum]
MSTGRAWRIDLDAARHRAGAVRTLLCRVVVGDRLGLAVFLGALVAIGLTWRIGFFISDSYTLANALVALADGSLVVEEAVYGTLESPGMVVHDGRYYGRNYGQVAAALPLLWALRGVTTVADLGLVFAALWSLVVLSLAVQVGRLVGRPSLCAVVGSGVALGAFALNAALAEPVAARLLPVAALQLGTVLAAALVATTVYRLGTRLHDRRVGVAAGATAVAATPVGFWAAIPKRHVTVTALLLGVVYAFYRSRADRDGGTDSLLTTAGFRGLAYALVGLWTWIHAGEAFVVFVALVAVDVPTAPSNDRRTLAVVGGAFLASLLPFLLTNAAISGDPLRAPRMLTPAAEATGGSAFGGGSGGTDGAGGTAGGTAVLPPVLGGVLATVADRLALLFEPFVAGARSVFADPESLYETFVRAGYDEYIGRHDNDQAINLSVLESAPLVAGVVAILATGATRATAAVRRDTRTPLREQFVSAVRTARSSPTAATDTFVALVAVLFVLVYMPRLPLFAQVTVRYLLPVYVLAVYALVRQDWVRRTLGVRGRAALWSYLAGVFLGAQLLFVVVAVWTVGRGGAVQLHAVAGLAVAVVFGVTATASALDDRFDGLTAVLSGITAALGTNLIALSALVYFQYGPYALPAVDWLADLLAAA